jgi:hypothetical protein
MNAREIAQKAAIARWGGKTPQATHKGNFKDEFGIDVECYVLNDAQKTAVISQRGMGVALGYSSQSGGKFPQLINSKTISEYLGPELKEKLKNPLIFQGPAMVPMGMPSINKLHGFDVTLLIDVCKAIIAVEADGKLKKNQERIATQAHIILNASAKAGIKGLVYALSGYDVTREEVLQHSSYMREEAREYEKEFPDQLYEQWYRLYKLPKPERNHPWKFKHLTVNQVYVPLARSKGKIHELVVAQKAASGERWKTTSILGRGWS